MTVLFILLESGLRFWSLGLLALTCLLFPLEADAMSPFAKVVLDYALAASALGLISRVLADWWMGSAKR
jgi:hypothetical protein